MRIDASTASEAGWLKAEEMAVTPLLGLFCGKTGEKTS
jgi:hypothetical protein